MSAFFALVFTCGYLTCESPKPIDFDTEEGCRAFVKPFVESRPNGISAVCFNRRTGEILVSSKQLYEESKKK